MSDDLLRALVAGHTPPRAVTEELLASVVDHRLHGLLDASYHCGELDLAPPQLTQLRATMLVERTHRKRIDISIDRAMGAIAEVAADVAVFKGVAVELQWYEGALERPCSDLDLLLSPRHFQRADDLVELLEPSHPLLGSIGRLFSSHRLQSVDVHIEGGASIDLHADLLKIEIPMRQATDIWSERLITIDLDGRMWHTVEKELALVQLLLHMNKDRFAYLLNVADVLRVIDGGGLDWGRVTDLAVREGIESHVFGALRRVMDWSGRDMPPDVRAHGSLVWRAMWPARLVGQGGSGIARRRRRQLLIPLTARGRVGEAVRALWRRWVKVDPVIRGALRDQGRDG